MIHVDPPAQATTEVPALREVFPLWGYCQASESHCYAHAKCFRLWDVSHHYPLSSWLDWASWLNGCKLQETLEKVGEGDVGRPETSGSGPRGATWVTWLDPGPGTSQITSPSSGLKNHDPENPSRPVPNPSPREYLWALQRADPIDHTKPWGASGRPVPPVWHHLTVRIWSRRYSSWSCTRERWIQPTANAESCHQFAATSSGFSQPRQAEQHWPREGRCTGERGVACQGEVPQEYSCVLAMRTPHPRTSLSWSSSNKCTETPGQ